MNRTRIIGTVVAFSLLAGCASTTSPTTKVGAVKPVVLTLATNDVGDDQIPAVTEFKQQVEKLTSGRLQVAISWRRDSATQANPEVATIADVAAGKYDFAWVGTRSMAGAGAPTFAALGAPMLIDSYPLERAVISSDVPAAMLATTRSTLHVEGLAVLADRLRQPYSSTAPLLGPSDYVGQSVWITPGSMEQELTAKALRSVPAQPKAGISLTSSFNRGGTQGAIFDVGYVRSNSMRPGYLTSNVVFWPRTVALIADPKSLDRLSTADRQSVRDAAAAAAKFSLTIGDDDRQLIDDLCLAGEMRTREADATQLAGLRAAVQPVYATLRQDPAVAALLGRIETIKQATPAVARPLPSTACRSSSAPTSAAASTAETVSAAPSGTVAAVTSGTVVAGTPLDGTYRVEATEADVRKIGFTRTTMADGTGCPVADCIAENVGVFTITFEGGREVGNQRSASGTASADSDWVGTYQVTRDRVTIAEPNGGSGTYTQTFRWSRAANGDLTLTPVPRPAVGHAGLWWLFIHPLTVVD